jgi:hypothetical protein
LEHRADIISLSLEHLHLTRNWNESAGKL